jgi:hypothetical protein
MRSFRRVALASIAFTFVLCTLAPSARADDATNRHLLAGVRAFKAHDYETALVELRVVQRSPEPPADLAFYLGPTLVKLGRDRDAIDVFVTSKAPADALADFYLGEAYYHARLFRKARGVFAQLRTRGLGPALDEAAAAYVAAVDNAYQMSSGDAVIDAYLGLAREAAGDAVFAGEAWDEARLVDGLATKKDPARSDEIGWQLARAYAAAGDSAHARPLLQAIAQGGGAHAADAASMLSSLPP